jgi:hypothetical protein
VVYDWHHGDGGVHERADDRRGEDDVRDGVVDGEEGNDEACQEEEDRDVKKDMTRLRNQSEFTQTAEAGGDDCRALDWGEKEVKAVIGTWVPFERPSSCWDICARRRTAFPAESGNKYL